MVFKPSNSPLITQLSALMLTGSLAMLLAVAAYQLVVVDVEIERQLVKEQLLEAQILAFRSIPAVMSQNNNQANLVIQSYVNTSADDEKFDQQGNKAINFAAILLPDGSLLGYYSKQKDIPLPEMDRSQRFRSYDGRIELTIDITQQTKTIGVLWIQLDKKLLLAQQRNYYYFLTIIGLVLVGGSILLARVFSSHLLNPVRRIAQVLLYQSEQGVFDQPLEINKNSYLTELVEGINQVGNGIQKQSSASQSKIVHLNKLLDVRTQQLVKKSHYDVLTGLPNRYLLVDRLSQAIANAKRRDGYLGLLFLDLDRFKVVNDNFGHQYGDQLLKEVATRLKNIARDGDTVARLGGDEFVFLLETLKQPKDAARTASRVIDSFSDAFTLQDHSIHLSTSIGISVYPSDGDDEKKLLKNADVSMYHAKKKGLGNFSYYSKEMNRASKERLAIETQLRQAIKKQEFRLVYQPQKRLSENGFRNLEALLRWESAELGNVSPGDFIPIAEETGIIKAIDLWVISETCKQMRSWAENGFFDVTVAINISAGHLISETLLEHLKTEIIVNQIRAEQIEIEITEEVFIEQTERTIQNLKKIKKLGAKIAIDDFGTGYSSLQYIRDFPADTLKLDGMFIRNLAHDKASQGIVRSTIILAHSLGLELVAECVESKAQFEFLQECQCDLIQGYYFSKPLEAKDVPSFCEKK